MARLLEVATARQRIESVWPQPRTCRMPVGSVHGFVLAEPIDAASDSPPYDKAMVDGYALQAAELQDGSIRLKVTAEILAGMTSHLPVTPGTTQRIMTGAPMPPGADTVIMVERTRELSQDATVEIDTSGAVAGQNVLRRATVIRQGDNVLASGRLLRAVDAGMLAEAGRGSVLVYDRPSITLFQTGDEVVSPEAELGPAQIRNSNGPLLENLFRPHASTLTNLGNVIDAPDAIRSAIAQGLTSDLLVITGGVSQGVRDLVPGLLRDAGVEEIFHRVAMKPGKPIWFGIRRHTHRTSLVFGLPGNPVSGLVGGLLFVMPTLRHLAGHTQTWDEPWQAGQLAHPFTTRGEVTTYWPCAFTHSSAADNFSSVPARPDLQPLPWRGSADLFTFAQAEALVELPPSPAAYPIGSLVRWHRV